MVLCKFFQQGNCRNGNRCTFEHIRQQNYNNNNYNNRNTNYNNHNFNNNNNNRNNNYGYVNNTNNNQQQSVSIDKSFIQKDFTTEKPLWPFSCYGHGKEEPCILKDTDWSPEEAKIAFLNSRTTTGHIQQYLNECQMRQTTMMQGMQEVLKDPDAALKKAKQIQAGNSLDSFSLDSTTASFGGNSNNNNGNSSSSSGMFGESFSANTSTGFGMASQGLGSQQTSNSGLMNSSFTTNNNSNSHTVSAFGGNSSFGGSTSDVFNSSNQSSRGFGSIGFGNPSSFGGSARFGQTSFTSSNNNNLATTNSAFGMPSTSAIGTSNNVVSGFGMVQSQPLQSSTANMGGNNGFLSNQTTTSFGNTTITLNPNQQQQQPVVNTFGQHQTHSSFNNGLANNNNEFNISPGDEQAFKSPSFVMGKIPETPPPTELVNLM